MKVLAVYNLKGGVGKTATAVNLAYLAARDGVRTLIWDLDAQGTATFYVRVRPKVRGGIRKLLRRRSDLRNHVRGTDFEMLDLVPSDFSYRHLDLQLDRVGKPEKRLRKLLRSVEEDYELVVLDCAPTISLVSDAVFTAADALLVPTIPTTLSLRTLSRLQRRLEQMGKARPRVLPFFCMVDPRRSLHRDVRRSVRAGDTRFLETEIPYSSTVERMGQRRAPIERYARGSDAALAFRGLWGEIRTRL